MDPSLSFERDEQPGIRQHRQMSKLAQAAVAIFHGEATFDDELFPPISFGDVPMEEREAGGVIPERMNMLYAFMAAFSAEAYGRASSPNNLQFSPGATIAKSLFQWDMAITKQYNRAISPNNFRKLFFEGGMWKVWLDPNVPEFAELRAALEQPGFSGFDKTAWMLDTVEQTRQTHFERPDDLPHVQSHVDACRFINTVLDIGFKELDLKTDAELEKLVGASIPELKKLALLHAQEMNAASKHLVDRQNPTMFQKRFMKPEADGSRVGLDQTAILEVIDQHVPEAPKLVRRGCPVVFLKTEYEGQRVPVFTVMGETLLRMYLQTGALSRPSIRRFDGYVIK